MSKLYHTKLLTYNYDNKKSEIVYLFVCFLFGIVNENINKKNPTSATKCRKLCFLEVLTFVSYIAVVLTCSRIMYPVVIDVSVEVPNWRYCKHIVSNRLYCLWVSKMVQNISIQGNVPKAYFPTCCLSDQSGICYDNHAVPLERGRYQIYEPKNGRAMCQQTVSFHCKHTIQITFIFSKVQTRGFIYTLVAR